MLKGKNILLCVSGSIAIYKSLELIRLYTKAGAKVRVLLSEEAKKFITPLTFETLSVQRVLSLDSESWVNKYNHIKITKNADIVVLAPATANTINKISSGIADNLLTQTLLANTKPLLIAPAMNTNMYKHFATKKSLKNLKKHHHLLLPVKKELACLDKGVGALADVEEIFLQTCKILLKDKSWSGKKVLITGGGTKEKIDDVRYIGNFSSGLMAKNLALALYLKGANVTLLSSGETKGLPCKIKNFQSSKELAKKTKKYLKKNEYLFMTAAVSDYTIKPKKGKLKKKNIGKKWKLVLKQNKDILKSLDKKGKKIVAFKAEFDEKNAFKNAKNALKQKGVDGVCLNVLGKDFSFGSSNSRISFISKKRVKNFSLNSKFNIALKIAKESRKL